MAPGTRAPTLFKPGSAAPSGRRTTVSLIQHQFVGHVVLVDVADVLDGLAADALGRDPFDVAEPDVAVQPAFRGFTP